MKYPLFWNNNSKMNPLQITREIWLKIPRVKLTQTPDFYLSFFGCFWRPYSSDVFKLISLYPGRSSWSRKGGWMIESKDTLIRLSNIPTFLNSLPEDLMFLCNHISRFWQLEFDFNNFVSSEYEPNNDLFVLISRRKYILIWKIQDNIRLSSRILESTKTHWV